MDKKYILLIISLLIILVGFSGLYFFNSTPETIPPDDLIVDKGANFDPKNNDYVIEGDIVKLNNGYSEEETAPSSTLKIITRYFGNDIKGDFNNDGIEDVAFLVTQESGGTGTFFYLISITSSGKSYIASQAIFIGDRIAPQNTEFKDEMIIVNYTDRKPDEPFSAKPSVGVSEYYKIIKNELVETIDYANIILCPPKSRDADFCTADVSPVCAEVEIQCIKAPCNPIKQTFNNVCEACKNPLVKSYSKGSCAQ